MFPSRLCSRFPAGWTVRFHHDVVQVWPGLSHIRGDQSQPFLRPRACLCATVLSSPYLVCRSGPLSTGQRAPPPHFAIAYVSRGGPFVKLCPAKYIVIGRFGLSVHSITLQPPLMRGRGNKPDAIHSHWDGEILRRTTTLSVRPRAPEPNGTTESPSRLAISCPLTCLRLAVFSAA